VPTKRTSAGNKKRVKRAYRPRVSRPRPFLLCFEGHRVDGWVWAVRVDGRRHRWHFAREVSLLAPTLTRYQGPTAREPRAYLAGVGVVTRRGPTLTITP
jgi:hypothetical protein